MKKDTFRRELIISADHRTNSKLEIDIINVMHEIEEGFKEIGHLRRRRLATVIIELAQNAKNYMEVNSEEDHSNICVITYNGKGGFMVTCSNVVDLENRMIIESRISKLLNLSKEKLDQYYDEVLAQKERTADGRNGLGLVSVVRNSSAIYFEFNQVSYNKFSFSIQVALNAEE